VRGILAEFSPESLADPNHQCDPPDAVDG